MKKSSLVVAGILIALSAVLASAAGGCSSKSTTRTSQKGEVCQSSNDCAGGLSCAPAGGGTGICAISQYNVAPTAKECVEVECAAAADCIYLCPPPSPQCASYLQQCADGGNPFYCQQYNQKCTCDASKLSCTNGKCGKICTSDNDCFGTASGSHCASGACVQCAQDTDCPIGDTCQSGQCLGACKSDGDCPVFSRCVNSACSADTACKTDRECVAYTSHVDATCGSDGKCVTPCQTDLECSPPESYTFFSCINHSCTYVGCATDKDCELSLLSNGSPPPPNVHFSCRDKTTP